MIPLTVGSLFSGIGGIDLGLERAGMRVAWQVEQNDYARRVLAKNFPGIPCYIDVRMPHGQKHGDHHIDVMCSRCLPAVDVLAGGFPCQDISVAGKGAGIKEGTRSGLWFEFARLVREIRPRYVLVENVPALRSRGLGLVLGDLAAGGYAAEWDCIPAAAVGAPHRRDRLFIVAHAQREQLRLGSGRVSGTDRPRSILPAGDGLAGTMAHANGERELQPSRRILTVGDGVATAVARITPWAVEPDVGRVAHGVPARVDRLRCLGNAVVPQVAEFVGRCIVAHAEAA